MGSVIEAAATPLDGFNIGFHDLRPHYADWRRHRDGAHTPEREAVNRVTTPEAAVAA